MPVFRRGPRPARRAGLPSPRRPLAVAPAPDVRAPLPDEGLGLLDPVTAELVDRHRDALADLSEAGGDATAAADLFDRVQALWRDGERRGDPAPLQAMFAVALGELVTRHAAGDGVALRWAAHRRAGAPVEVVLTDVDHRVVVLLLPGVRRVWGRTAPGWLAERAAELAAGAVAVVAPAAVRTA